MADAKEISAAFPCESKFIDVEGSEIHYVEELAGQPARSYETFARDFAQAFSGASAGAPA